MKFTWRATGASSRGKAHDANGMPNQDAFACNARGGAMPLVVAVSDGHGGEAYFRSDVGSRFAVDAALEVLQRPPAQKDLPAALVHAWRARVDAHLRSNPFTPQEQMIVARQTWGADPVEAYGATMLALALYEREIVYVQLGDGDLLRVAQDGRTERMFFKDPRLAVNQTHSLCDPEAETLLQQRREARNGDDPAMLMAATDGYSNSFASDNDFLKIGDDLLQMIRESGIDDVSEELPRMLKETSDAGSMDDITLGMLVNMNAVGRAGDARPEPVTVAAAHREVFPTSSKSSRFIVRVASIVIAVAVLAVAYLALNERKPMPPAPPAPVPTGTGDHAAAPIDPVAKERSDAERLTRRAADPSERQHGSTWQPVVASWSRVIALDGKMGEADSRVLGSDEAHYAYALRGEAPGQASTPADRAALIQASHLDACWHTALTTWAGPSMPSLTEFEAVCISRAPRHAKPEEQGSPP